MRVNLAKALVDRSYALRILFLGRAGLIIDFEVFGTLDRKHVIVLWRIGLLDLFLLSIESLVNIWLTVS